MNGNLKTDESIKHEIRERLLSVSEVDSHNFNIEVDHGVVKIQGEVSGRHAKRLTEACVTGVEGIRNIENQLKIRRITRFTDNSMHGF